MKAIVLEKPGDFGGLKYKDFAVPKPEQDQVLIEIKGAALNRRDAWIVQGLYPKIKVPIILGSDGSGIIAEVGKKVSKDLLGQEVVVNPALNWGINPGAQQNSFKILGMPDNGTLAEYVQIPVSQVFPKPHHLTFEEAAAIPLCGLTGYRALFVQGKLKAGERILITGIGGGVATLMLQMAVAAGAEVAVTSSSDQKIASAMRAGALGGVNYRRHSWVEELKKLMEGEQFDMIVDSAGGDTFDELIKLVKPGGRIISYGATAGKPSSVNLHRIFWRQITVQGATMGTPIDFTKMVELFNSRKIKPLIDSVVSFKEYKAVFNKLVNFDQFGKVVLKP